jgi:hypothetical protein
MATLCQTSIGSCFMVQPVPRGYPCACYTAYGPVSGVGM